MKLSKDYNNTVTDVAYINILEKRIINTYGSMLSETTQSKSTQPHAMLSVQKHPPQEALPEPRLTETPLVSCTPT